MSGTDRREFLKGLAACSVALPLLSAENHSLWAAWHDSPRRTLDLGDTPWLFLKGDPNPEAKNPGFDDSSWTPVGVPHCFNENDTYQNLSLNRAFRGTVWYRKHLFVDERDKGKRALLEFHGVDIAAAVYVNGRFQKGNTVVPQPQEVTHVGGFIPFALDITDDLHYGAENLIAVRVSNAEHSFFTWPGFAAFLGLGMGFGGIVCPVYLHMTDPVHIPLNAWSPMEKWGIYMATVEADQQRAQLRAWTNVENQSADSCDLVLTTQLLDAEGTAVLTMRSTQTVAAGSICPFEQSGEIPHPRLWYPNNSELGSPYLYRVVSSIVVDGRLRDRVETPFGVRTLRWDSDYGYVNGTKHLLNGFGQRNTYPALGSAVPAEVQWNDIRLIAECGGSALRVGHLPATPQAVAACDAYGILVIQDSGDNEWALYGETAVTYKQEYDRDTIIYFRNHPSVAVWESNNGLASVKHHTDIYSPRRTQELVDRWDPAGGRIVESRDTSDYWPKDKKIMIGYTAHYKKVVGSPSINLECYYRGNARFDYAHEKEFAAFFAKQYLSNIQDSACGWIFWMLAETMETPFLPYLNGLTHQKSLGSCAMDGNRFPKLAYKVFQNALWRPYSMKPGVALQSSWNLSGVQDVDAWSNCPRVELFLNGSSRGIRTPDAERRCTWEKIVWEPGTLKAVGLDKTGCPVCADERRTSGKPRRILLSAEPQLTRPDGSRFRLRANGSDVALITAKVIDSNGIVCVDADNELNFSVAGPADYRGSYDFYENPARPAAWHSPGDRQLQAEGGLMRIAIRSTFHPGKVRVTATSPGLDPGHAEFHTERSAS